MERPDLREIVDTPAFQRAFRRYARESVEGRVLRGLERLARGATRRVDREPQKDARRRARMAAGQTLNDPRYAGL
jgi:hypothetical protein